MTVGAETRLTVPGDAGGQAGERRRGVSMQILCKPVAPPAGGHGARLILPGGTWTHHFTSAGTSEGEQSAAPEDGWGGEDGALVPAEGMKRSRKRKTGISTSFAMRMPKRKAPSR